MTVAETFVLFAALATGASAGTIRVDFGQTYPIDGHPTSSPDINGNHWNNAASGFNVAPGLFLTALVITDNTPTSIGLTVSTGWKANGKRNGGLLAPDSALLGQLAIPTATEDYFFVEGADGNSATVTLSGLDPGKKYNVRLFGTRQEPGARSTTYTMIAGSGTTSQILQTSGTGIGANGYNGNALVKATCDANPTLHFLDVATFFENLYDNERPAIDALYVDDIHLNRAGYREWLRIIRPQFEAVVAPNKSLVSNP